MLYAFGSNGSGQLGIRGKEDTDTPMKCVFPEEADLAEPPIKIAAGGNHTLVLFKSGDLYSVGSNVHGQTGHSLGHDSDTLEQVVLCAQESKIKFCSALWEASVLVTTDDEVYTFGKGSKGELGTGNSTSSQPQTVSRFAPSGLGIVDLASCVYHTVAVLSNGDVYGWGDGRKGQLGEPMEHVWRPRKIESIGFKVLRALCGKEFTYLVGDPTQGHHTIIGANKWDIKSSAPATNFHWQSIGASWGSIFVLKNCGQIDSWGRNDLGQLPPKSLPDVDLIAVGSEHVLALTKSAQIVSWGWGEHGNCGPKKNQMGVVNDRWSNISFNPPINSAKTKMIAAGCATSFAWI